MVEAVPATGMDEETGEVLVSLSNRADEAWVSELRDFEDPVRIAEDDPGGRGDLFGASVNRAARIAAMAQGGDREMV